jgi:hypothetical protein
LDFDLVGVVFLSELHLFPFFSRERFGSDGNTFLEAHGKAKALASGITDLEQNQSQTPEQSAKNDRTNKYHLYLW